VVVFRNARSPALLSDAVTLEMREISIIGSNKLAVGVQWKVEKPAAPVIGCRQLFLLVAGMAEMSDTRPFRMYPNIWRGTPATGPKPRFCHTFPLCSNKRGDSHVTKAAAATREARKQSEFPYCDRSTSSPPAASMAVAQDGELFTAMAMLSVMSASHMSMPNYWLPYTIVGRAQGWTLGCTLLVGASRLLPTCAETITSVACFGASF
jgi:hypothetical protein